MPHPGNQILSHFSLFYVDFYLKFLLEYPFQCMFRMSLISLTYFFYYIKLQTLASFF